jgi:sulfate adenylyltransferase subunit 2
MVDDERYPLRDGEVPEMKMIRFRTLGCYPLTAALNQLLQQFPKSLKKFLRVQLSSEQQG